MTERDSENKQTANHVTPRIENAFSSVWNDDSDVEASDFLEYKWSLRVQAIVGVFIVTIGIIGGVTKNKL